MVRQQSMSLAVIRQGKVKRVCVVCANRVYDLGARYLKEHRCMPAMKIDSHFDSHAERYQRYPVDIGGMVMV